MYFVDRSSVLIQPKQPFLNWLLSVENDDLTLTLEQIRTDCNNFLIPQFDAPEEAISYIDDIYLSIFKAELSSWYEDPELWPADMSLQAFWEMFDVSIQSMVIDTVEDELNNKTMTFDEDDEDSEEVAALLKN